MRQLAGAILLAASGSTAQAQDWHVLVGAGIAQGLTDRTVIYDNGATQHFYASGRTLYTFGEPSWGSWRIENDRYCSLWPPAPDWDCYEVQSNGAGGVMFVDPWGNTSASVIAPQ